MLRAQANQAGPMTSNALVLEYIAKAEEAERQAAKVMQQTVKDSFLKLATTYRNVAKVLETG